MKRGGGVRRVFLCRRSLCGACVEMLGDAPLGLENAADVRHGQPGA